MATNPHPMITNVYNRVDPFFYNTKMFMPIPHATEVRLRLDLDPEDSIPGKMPDVTWYRATPSNVLHLEQHGIITRHAGEIIL